MGKAIRVGAVLLVMAVLAALVVGTLGGFRFESFARRYAELSAEIAAHPVLSTLIGLAIYAALVVSLMPGVPFATVPFGLAYGWGQGALVVLAGTAAGTSLLYFAVRFLLPERFAGKAGRALERISAGIETHMIATMLALRLMPPVPFTLLNVALPGLKIPFVPYIATTLIGMAPRILVYALAGEGIRAVVDRQVAACVTTPGDTCELDLSMSDFLSTEIIVATALLGVLAVVPLVWRWVANRFSGSTPPAR